MMRKIYFPAIAGVFLLVTAAFLLHSQQPDGLFGINTPPAPDLPQTVSGKVVTLDGEVVSDAIVQYQGTPIQVTTDKNGRFTLNGLKGKGPAVLVGWFDGHYTGWVEVNPAAKDWKGGQDLTIKLKPLPVNDNHLYGWFEHDGVQGTASCGLCHREYDEWLRDAHSQSATNPRFLSMYLGTDIHGNRGQPVQRDMNGLPLPPDPDLPYYGPGYRLDEPQRAGNCSTCHTPLAAKIPNQNNCGWSGCHTDLTSERANGLIDYGVMAWPLEGDAAEGVTCDFCHKVQDVILDPDTGLPYADMPGILSMKLLRPEEGEQVFFGTVLDVNRRVSYAPVMSESEFCAPCHFGVFGGVVGHGTVSGGTIIYNSYGEWLDSPYSDPVSGQTCQDCHMPVVDEKWYVFPEQGGLIRDYVDLHDHYMPGASDHDLLQNAVTLTASASATGGKLTVDVSLVNDQTGHHVPTDAPTRQMLLVVEAVNSKGQRLKLVQGPIQPEYSGNYAGWPGKSYAKVLRDEWTGEAPSAAWWRPVTIKEDTRLAAFEKDLSQYVFDLPAGEQAEVRVRVWFRRTFERIAAEKGWSDPDILMQETILQVQGSR
jgi:hypothetical protein